MIDKRLDPELHALDAAVRAYAAKWNALQEETSDDVVTVQGWVVSAEFTSFDLIDRDAYGHVLVGPTEQMASTSRGLAEIARDKYGR